MGASWRSDAHELTLSPGTNRALRVRAWESRPIFVSSTFRDFHAERDHLQRVVLPALRARLRTARVPCHAEFVDLRWGVATTGKAGEEAKQLEVLKVCLKEAASSRPFALVLLGGRYGWEPPAERARRAAADAGLDAVVDGRSVTALEVEQGLLARPDLARRSYVYVRRLRGVPAARETDFRDAPGSDAAARRDQLVSRVRAEVPRNRVRGYEARWDDAAAAPARSDLDAWGARVERDIFGAVRAEYAALRPPASWIEEEEAALAEYAFEKARDFVGREKETQGALDHLLRADGATWGACYAGDSGAGKSSFFAHLLGKVGESGGVVLAHAAGIGPRSTSVDLMLRRWAGTLAARLGERPPVDDATAPQDVRAAFGELLRRVAQESRVLVLVDALDQFERSPAATRVQWVPDPWPANARLLATAVSGDATESLGERAGVEVRPLPPMGPQDAAALARAMFARRRRTPDEAMMEALLCGGPQRRRAAGSPLWLELAVEDLNQLAAEDFARLPEFEGSEEARLAALLARTARTLPDDVDGLFARTLSRAAAAVGGEAGAKWVAAFAGALAASRQGLRDSDLRALLPELSGEPWSDLSFSRLRWSLGTQLVVRGPVGLLECAHPRMREALRRTAPGDRARTHGLLARRLLDVGIEDALAQSETMVHLIGARDREGAVRYAVGLPSGHPALRGAVEAITACLAGRLAAERAGAAEWTLGLLDAESIDADARVRFAEILQHDVCRALANEHDALRLQDGLLSRVLSLLGRAVATAPRRRSWLRELSVTRERIGEVQRARGDVAGAERSHRAALAISKRLAAREPGAAARRRDLAIGLCKVAELRHAQGDLAGALRGYSAALAIRRALVAQAPRSAAWLDGLATVLDSVGDVRTAQGRLADAEACRRESLAIRTRLASRRDATAELRRAAAVGHVKTGDLESARGDLAAAERAFSAGHAVFERLADDDPEDAALQRELSTSHERLGDARMERRDFAGAEECYVAALAVARRLAARDEGSVERARDVAMSYSKLGDARLARRDAAGAQQAFDAALDIRSALVAGAPSNAALRRDHAASLSKAGDLALARGDATAAERSYRAMFAVRMRLSRDEPANPERARDLALAYEKVGDLRKAGRRPARADRAYRASLELRRRLASRRDAGADSRRDVAVSLAKIGEIRQSRADVDGASESFEEALAILRRLAARDPENAARLRDVAAACNRLAGLRRVQRDFAGAERLYLQCLRIWRGLAGAGGGPAQTEVAVICAAVAETRSARDDLAGALRYRRAAVDALELAAAAAPGSASALRDLALGLTRVGELEQASGDLDGARRTAAASLEIRRRLSKSQPSNASLRRDVAMGHSAVADVAAARRDFAGARQSYSRSHAVLRQLAASEPENAGRLIDVMISFDKLGWLHMESGDLAVAERYFLGSLDIARRVAANSPGDPDAQRFVTACLERLEDLRVARKGTPLSPRRRPTQRPR